MTGSGVICLLPLSYQWLAVAISNNYDVFIFFALPASFILMLIFAVPATALVVKRMHGIGYSGWWVTIAVLIPVTGVILFVLRCLPPKSQDQVQ